MDQNPEFRSQEIKTRLLEIAATLAEWKRAYFVDGIERDFCDRVSLEAEDAALRLELHSIKSAAMRERLERRIRLNASLLAHLIELLTERGHEELLQEAQRKADESALVEQVN